MADLGAATVARPRRRATAPAGRWEIVPVTDNERQLCKEECEEIVGFCAHQERTYTMRRPRRKIRQSWSFVECSARLGYVAPLPMQGEPEEMGVNNG